MSPSAPFFDAETGSLDTDQLVAETVPLAKLVALVAAAAVVPFALVWLLGGHSPVAVVLMVIAQYVLAIGTGLVLIYVVARGMALGGE